MLKGRSKLEQNTWKGVSEALESDETASAALASADSASQTYQWHVLLQTMRPSGYNCAALLSGTSTHASHVQPDWRASRATKASRNLIAFRMKKGLAIGKP